MNSNNSHADEINLLKIIRYLCTTKIRHPMTIEEIKAWLKQFDRGAEKTLAMLILRHLIYRTSSQLESSLKQALKLAAINFIPSDSVRENTDWRDILNGNDGKLEFCYGPPKNEYTPPGKSGEIIARLLKHCVPTNKFALNYPDQIATLTEKERFLIIDDASLTGDQLIDFIKQKGSFLLKNNQSGIVVALAHERAIDSLAKAYPSIPLFYGEKITPHECFMEMAKNWVDEEIWHFSDITPLEQYLTIVKRAKFENELPFGYGNLGCMIAYEHGVPDDSLQLLWGKSDHWCPLFER